MIPFSNFTRRLFFRRVATATLPLAGIEAGASPTHAPERPARCWTIMGADWETNDEYLWQAGKYATGTLFHSQEAAEAACRKSNDEFYASEDPCDFDSEFRDDVTWETLLAEGSVREPFHVQELVQPDEPRLHSR